MRSAAELKNFCILAMRMLARERDIGAFEIYSSSSVHRIARLGYTSEIPCRGVEEVKALQADGFQVRIEMKSDPHAIGTAYEAGDFSMAALRNALASARRATVVDPHFPGFPFDRARLPSASGAHDLARARDPELARCAWRILDGALAMFRKNTAGRQPDKGLVIGGDISIVHDRIAIATSHFPTVRSDESAHFSASVTALIESLDAKGTASAMGATIAEMRRAAHEGGRMAVRRAFSLRSGARPPSGKYRVVLGPQPIAEILNYMVMGSLTTGAFHAASSAYHGMFGERVMDERISIVDDPGVGAGAVHRRITCEGLPARRTTLIADGKLTGLLSTCYDSHRLEQDENRAEKLGPKGAAVHFPPLNAYRLGEGGGRRFDSSPGSAGTNVIMRAHGGLSERELVRMVGDGIYIGRVWYTYPINGQRAGDFTCTVSGDSYVIRDGQLSEPLAPNSLRINANIRQILDSPIAVASQPKPAIVWGAPEAYYVPAIAADAITLSAIGGEN